MGKAMLLFAAAAALCLGADPFVGTWKPTDLDKWKITPGGGSSPDEKRMLLKIEEVSANTHRITYVAMDPAIVVPDPQEFSFDGVERKTPSAKAPDRVSRFERIDSHHVRATVSSSKGRRLTDSTVSPDGKTMMTRVSGNTANTGHPVDDLLIYAKQDK